MADSTETVIPSETPPVRTQPGKNGGRLRVGGTNKNAGRPPSAIRAQMRGALAKRVKIAEQIADDTHASQSDRIRALDFLAKYGLGTTQTQTDADGNDAPPPATTVNVALVSAPTEDVTPTGGRFQ